MDTNENKEEVIEELNDIEVTQPADETLIKDDITADKKIDDVILTENNESINLNESVVLEASNVNTDEHENQSVVLENNIGEEKTTENVEKPESETVEPSMVEIKKKSKMPLIILLSILLVIDVAALVIYIIGIDKVLGFIK